MGLHHHTIVRTPGFEPYCRGCGWVMSDKPDPECDLRDPEYHEHVAGDRHAHAYTGPHSHGGVSALSAPASATPDRAARALGLVEADAPIAEMARVRRETSTRADGSRKSVREYLSDTKPAAQAAAARHSTGSSATAEGLRGALAETIDWITVNEDALGHGYCDLNVGGGWASDECTCGFDDKMARWRAALQAASESSDTSKPPGPPDPPRRQYPEPMP